MVFMRCSSDASTERASAPSTYIGDIEVSFGPPDRLQAREIYQIVNKLLRGMQMILHSVT